MASSVDFAEIQELLDADFALRDRIREAVREVQKVTRTMTGVLNRAHGATPLQIEGLLSQADAALPALRAALSGLGSLIPNGQFWRYHESFDRTMQQAATMIVLRGWLAENLAPSGALRGPTADENAVVGLVSKEEVSSILGLQPPLLLTTEDYLHSLISLINELSRLAVNAVTAGLFHLPVSVCRFCKDLSAGFAMLNLKNDALRKRFDAIKYDVKRLEEVVYDITLRGLYKPPTAEPTNPT